MQFLLGTNPRDPFVPPKTNTLPPKLYPFRAFLAADPWIPREKSFQVDWPPATKATVHWR